MSDTAPSLRLGPRLAGKSGRNIDESTGRLHCGGRGRCCSLRRLDLSIQVGGGIGAAGIGGGGGRSSIAIGGLTAAMTMMMAFVRLHILLKGGKSLLRSGQITILQGRLERLVIGGRIQVP